MKRAFLISAILVLTACEQQPAGEPVVRASLDGEAVPNETVPIEAATEPQIAAQSACSDVTFEQLSFTHCIADPQAHRIQTALEGEGRTLFGSLAAYQRRVDSSSVAFAMNAGSFGDDLRPLGYFVEDSERLSPLNQSDGQGNFFLKPNGVFFGSGGTWRVLSTQNFFNTIGDRPEFGTQSGPMLVIDGELHPEIAQNGPSRTIRNGVGVDDEGKAHFVITNQDTSFGQLARFFRDELGIANALCLDSNVSALWDPAKRRESDSRIGPILVVTKREP